MDVVLDGGPCAVGVESTIVELVGVDPVLLRPGGITVEQLEATLGRRVALSRGPSRAPGMLASHYAPNALVEIVDAATIAPRAAAAARRGANGRDAAAE